MRLGQRSSSRVIGGVQGGYSGHLYGGGAVRAAGIWGYTAAMQVGRWDEQSDDCEAEVEALSLCVSLHPGSLSSDD